MLTDYHDVSGLGNLDQAEQYLLQAQWTVLKTPECSNTIRHKLSRYLGLLYAAKNQFSHALRQLAYDVRHNITSLPTTTALLCNFIFQVISNHFNFSHLVSNFFIGMT